MSKPKLTIKEAKLVKATIEGKNQTEAGLAADPNRKPETARVWANETLQKPTVQEAIQIAMAQQGITPEKIVKPIAEGLEAEKVHIVGNGDQAMAEVVPDHGTRIKSAQIAAQWMGMSSKEGGTTNNFIQIINGQRNQYDL